MDFFFIEQFIIFMKLIRFSLDTSESVLVLERVSLQSCVEVILLGGAEFVIQQRKKILRDIILKIKKSSLWTQSKQLIHRSSKLKREAFKLLICTFLLLIQIVFERLLSFFFARESVQQQRGFKSYFLTITAIMNTKAGSVFRR